MPMIEQDGLKIDVDDDGFLVRIEDWTEQVARVLAAREGIADLPGYRLDILRFLREYLGHAVVALFETETERSMNS